MTLIELMAATTMMATIMASTVVLVRSSYAVWQATEADLEQSENACAVLRHLVRNVRQAREVSAITSSTLEVITIAGDRQQWVLGGGGAQVLYGLSPQPTDQLLAADVLNLVFVGYEADGTTSTTATEDIHSVHCTVAVAMPGGGGSTKTVSCRAWLRSW